MEEKAGTTQKFCEIEGMEDFNCIDCPEFETCQLILYDSHGDESAEDDKDESGLTIV